MKRLAALMAVVVAVLVNAGPAQAASSSFGSDGLCKSVTIAPGQAQLVRVGITPPQLDDPSRAGLRAGWKFDLWLTFWDDGVMRPQYKSALQSRTGNESGHYAFTKRGRSQALDGSPQATLQLTLKVFLYKASGKLAEKTVVPVSWYHYIRDGVEVGAGPDPCLLITTF